MGALRPRGSGSLATALLLALVLTVLHAARPSGRAKIRLVNRLLDVRSCDYKPSGMRLFNVSYRTEPDGREYVDGELEILRPVSSFKRVGAVLPHGCGAWESLLYRGCRRHLALPQLTIITHRCEDGWGTSRCEYVGRWTVSSGICQLLEAPGRIWSPSLSSISPALKCPVTPGFRHIRNASLDAGALRRYWELLESMGWHEWEKYSWPFEFQMFNEDDVLSYCVRGTTVTRQLIARKKEPGSG